jgi:hypothetical protein
MCQEITVVKYLGLTLMYNGELATQRLIEFGSLKYAYHTGSSQDACVHERWWGKLSFLPKNEIVTGSDIQT